MGKIIAQEVEFKVRIENGEFNFFQYRTIIHQAANEKLGYNYNDVASNEPLKILFQNRLEAVFNNEEIIVIPRKYTEKQGSFLVTFSFFVFGTFMNYGSFRESLDYLQEDFNFFFRDAFPRTTRVDLDYTTRQNRAIVGFQRSLVSNALLPLQKQFNLLKGIVALVAILSIGLALFSISKVDELSEKPVDTTVRMIVKEEVEQLDTRRINKELLQLLQELKRDTMKVDRKKSN